MPVSPVASLYIAFAGRLAIGRIILEGHDPTSLIVVVRSHRGAARFLFCPVPLIGEQFELGTS